MKRAILVMLLLDISIICHSQKLLINPGFEYWDKINKPSGWTHAENCLKDSTLINSGTYSCLHTGGTTTTSDLGQTIPVAAGKAYTLSFYYRTGNPSTGNGSRIWCYWKDASGNSITDPSTDAIIRPSKYLKSDIWDQFSICITAPAQAAGFYFEVRTNSNSMMYWDDFVFEETIATGNNENTESIPEIYPNPAYDYLTIINIEDFQCIDILNITGTKVWSSRISGEQSILIPVSGFTDGVYIIRIISSGRLITRKFIKNVF